MLEAAVVTQPDGVFGEQPVAFVALGHGHAAVPDDLIEHYYRQSLARYKVPHAVYLEEKLPKSAIGKIAKQVLRARLTRG